MSESPSERLKKAGLLHANHNYTADELATIDALTHDEVDTVIAVHGKLGDGIVRKKKDDDDISPDTLIL